MRREPRAFSMIELLVVLLIMGTVMSVIVACFASGFRVFEHVSTFSDNEVNVHLAGALVERDLKNALLLLDAVHEGPPEAGMEWGASAMAFVTRDADGLLHVRYQRSPPASRQPGLWRSVGRLGSGGAVQQPRESEQLLDTNYTMRLSYAGQAEAAALGKPGARAEWPPAWSSKTNLPHAVSLRIASERLESGTLRRTVRLPGGGEP